MRPVHSVYYASASGKNNYVEFAALATGATGLYTCEWYVDPSRTGNNYQRVGSGATFGTCLNSYSAMILVRVIARSGSQSAQADYYAQPQLRQAVYPNPADSYVELGSEEPVPVGEQPKALHVHVYNGQGKEVFAAANLMTPTIRLNTQAWPAGLYQVTLQRGSTITRRQLSVQH